MIIYHGHPSDNSLERCRESAPSHQHRAMFSEYLTNREDVRYAIDNGAFKMWREGKDWYRDKRAQKFVDMVERSKTKPRLPDFIVLPDVVMDPGATRKRTQHWIHILEEDIDIDTDFYMPCQTGMSAASTIRWADTIGADGIFVGGDQDYKRFVVHGLVESDYPVHVGRPGDLVWANHVGVDSVDTTSIVFDGSFHRLEQLEGQTELTEAESTDD